MSTAGNSGPLAALSNDIAGAVESAGKAIVTVHGRRRGPASGIIWPGGTIVTADHVLERDEDIVVKMPDGQESKATVAGRDPGSDVAILKLPGGAAAAAELAPAGSVKVGHFVLAVGRPGEGGAMASFGIVSAIGGTWRTARGGTLPGYIRADVTLYPGFSGGPLIDAQGRVVGLNSSHLAQGQELAIPAGAVTNVVQALLTHGRVRRAYLGISSQPVILISQLRQKHSLAQEVGLMIIGVENGSPAEAAGLLMGDVLTALADQTIADAEDLQAVLGADLVGKATIARIVRGGELKDVSITPGERA